MNNHVHLGQVISLGHLPLFCRSIFLCLVRTGISTAYTKIVLQLINKKQKEGNQVRKKWDRGKKNQKLWAGEWKNNWAQDLALSFLTGQELCWVVQNSASKPSWSTPVTVPQTVWHLRALSCPWPSSWTTHLSSSRACPLSWHLIHVTLIPLTGSLFTASDYTSDLKMLSTLCQNIIWRLSWFPYEEITSTLNVLFNSLTCKPAERQGQFHEDMGNFIYIVSGENEC